MSTARDALGNRVFGEDQLVGLDESILEGDYHEDASIHLAVKQATFKPSQCKIWQDRVVSAEQDAAVLMMEFDAQLSAHERASVQLAFDKDCLHISKDVASHTAFHVRQKEGVDKKHLLQVSHLISENRRGTAAVAAFMSRECQHVVQPLGAADPLIDHVGS